MSSYKMFKKEVVHVIKSIGSKGFSFFKSAKHGDVFFHVQNLADDGFELDDLVVGCSAVVDIEIFANGKQRTVKIHELNCRPGGPKVVKGRQQIRYLTPAKKTTFSAGARSRGQVKILHEGYGFIEKPGYEDMFFPMNCVLPNLTPFLKAGTEVRFEVEACDRGIMAYITEILWQESQITRSLVDANEKLSLYIIELNFPTGQCTLEVRDGPPGVNSKLIAQPATLADARKKIGKDVSLRLVTNLASRHQDG